MIIVGKGNSAKALRQALGAEKGRMDDGGLFVRRRVARLRDGRSRFRETRYASHPGNLVVMWGVDLGPNHWLPRGGPVLNARVLSDKIRQLDTFWHRNVAAPVFALPRDREVYTVPAGIRDGTWLARKRHHFGGRDIRGPMDFTDLAQRLLAGTADYGVRVVNKTHEWRVHVFGEKILRIARKIPNEGAGVVWNQGNAHFRYDVGLGEATSRQLTALAIDATSALGMDFGAVDIIREGRRGDHRYYVLEVNSAPGISDNENTLRAYVEAFRGWVR